MRICCGNGLARNWLAAAVAGFIGSFVASTAVSYYQHQCARPRRALEDILAVCRDADRDSIVSTYYEQLKLVAGSQSSRDQVN